MRKEKKRKPNANLNPSQVITQVVLLLEHRVMMASLHLKEINI
jgi:hypothetical protein